jgi:hypothetical protein
MQIELRARNIVVTDARDAYVVRRYISAKKRSVIEPVTSLWNKQRELVTTDTAKHALQLGSVPSEWSDIWDKMITEFVRDDLVPEWIKGISSAGEGIAKRVNRIQRKQFDFNPAMQSVRTWVDSQGGTLIANLTTAQFNAVHTLLQNQIAQGMTSPYVLAQRVRPIVGLTEKEAAYVTKVMTALIEEGVPVNAVNNQIERLANTLHKNRALRIARTELSDAYNFGQMDSLRQAVIEGWLPGTPEKSWMAGGANPCEVCEENEGVGAIPLEDVFPSGDEHPTAHPSCECSLGYKIRR